MLPIAVGGNESNIDHTIFHIFKKERDEMIIMMIKIGKKFLITAITHYTGT